jgi:hypothetical protein
MVVVDQLVVLLVAMYFYFMRLLSMFCLSQVYFIGRHFFRDRSKALLLKDFFISRNLTIKEELFESLQLDSADNFTDENIKDCHQDHNYSSMESKIGPLIKFLRILVEIQIRFI